MRKKAICKKYGMEGLFPMDNTIDSTGLTLQEIGFVIIRANVGLMNKADIVVANLTPFRGPSGDPGTCYEAHSSGHAEAAWRVPPRSRLTGPAGGLHVCLRQDLLRL